MHYEQFTYYFDKCLWSLKVYAHMKEIYSKGLYQDLLHMYVLSSTVSHHKHGAAAVQRYRIILTQSPLATSIRCDVSLQDTALLLISCGNAPFVSTRLATPVDAVAIDRPPCVVLIEKEKRRCTPIPCVRLLY